MVSWLTFLIGSALRGSSGKITRSMQIALFSSIFDAVDGMSEAGIKTWHGALYMILLPFVVLFIVFLLIRFEISG